ncbi:hypothetical protein E2C01_039946 [Portunus trituberculatus]|uniref:Uncharacterized protein n=1 Tax=Portunus trituberculatus TaxID=210409 RepID=A0A5B7FIB7_PORTR|nr:hypothetical protein [Portunus trituberculatus]
MNRSEKRYEKHGDIPSKCINDESDLIRHQGLLDINLCILWISVTLITSFNLSRLGVTFMLADRGRRNGPKKSLQSICSIIDAPRDGIC